MANDLLREAVAVAKEGDRQQAVRLAKQYIKSNKNDPRGWYALAKLSDDEDVKIKALERVLELSPDNNRAREMLDKLRPPEMSSDLFSFEDDDDDDNDDVFTSETYANAGGSFLDADSVFGDDDTSSGSGDPARNARQKQQKAKQPARSGGGSSVELILGILVFVVAIAGVIGLGYYAYFFQHRGLFGLFGPDLSNNASHAGVQVHFPGDWESSIEYNAIRAGNNLAPSEDGCPSTAAFEEALFSLLIGQGSPDALGFDVSDTTYEMVLGPVTSEDMQILNGCLGVNYSNAQEFVSQTVNTTQTIDESQDGTTVRTDASFENTTIAGVDGNYAFVTAFISVDQFDVEVAVGSYYGVFVIDELEYLFVLNVYGENADSQHQLATRILHSIETTR